MAITLITQSKYHQRISLTAVAANATNSSDSVNTETYYEATVQVLHATHTDTSTYALQASVDGGTTWDTISGTSKTTSGASGSTSQHISGLPGGLIKLLVTETDANASSTLTPYITLRR